MAPHIHGRRAHAFFDSRSCCKCHCKGKFASRSLPDSRQPAVSARHQLVRSPLASRSAVSGPPPRPGTITPLRQRRAQTFVRACIARIMVALSKVSQRRDAESIGEAAGQGIAPRKRHRVDGAPVDSPAFTDSSDSDDESYGHYQLTVCVREEAEADRATSAESIAQGGFSCSLGGAVRREQLLQGSALSASSSAEVSPSSEGLMQGSAPGASSSAEVSPSSGDLAVGTCLRTQRLRAIAVKLILDMGDELCQRSLVIVQGLRNQQNLNGLVGHLHRFDTGKQRFVVKLPAAPAERRKVVISSDHLRLAQPDSGCSGSGAGSSPAKLCGVECGALQCLAVEILDRVLATTPGLDPADAISSRVSLAAKLLGRDCFSLALKATTVAAPSLGLICEEDYGPSKITLAELGSMPRETLEHPAQAAQAREFEIFKLIGFRVETGAATAHDFLSLLMQQVTKRPIRHAICIHKRSFYQDRLGTNIGQALNNRTFLRSTPCRRRAQCQPAIYCESAASQSTQRAWSARS